MPLSTVFQSYHGDKSHCSCLSWVSPVLGWGSEVSCDKDTPTKKPRGSSATRTQDPWITSQTLNQWATQDPSLTQKAFKKYCGKSRKWWLTSIFSYCFLPEAIFNVLSANAFNLLDCWLIVNPFPNDKFYTLPNWKSLQTTISNLMKMAESSPNGSKTLWEMEKLLVMSNFSFSHSVFKSLSLQTRKNQGLFGKGFIGFNATLTAKVI